LCTFANEIVCQVTDYDVRGINLIYSSADIYTHGTNGAKRVLIVYGLAGETHELAFSSKLGKPSVEGGSVKIGKKGSAYVVQWKVSAKRKVLHYGNKLDVYLLWRNEAFKYWTLQLESPPPIGNYTSQTKETVIAKAGYLLRTATRSEKSLYLTGDLNTTSSLEILAGAKNVKNVHFNGKKLHLTQSSHGRLTATLEYLPPSLQIPDLTKLRWKYIDSLPEAKPEYDDSTWIVADNTETNNTVRDEPAGNVFSLKTPTSLIASDYGFHTGSLIYRGHFTATGNESSLYLSTTGGLAFGHSVWINETYIGSWIGNSTARSYDQTLDIPSTLSLHADKTYIIIVVIDHMGMETNWSPRHHRLRSLRTPAKRHHLEADRQPRRRELPRPNSRSAERGRLLRRKAGLPSPGTSDRLLAARITSERHQESWHSIVQREFRLGRPRRLRRAHEFRLRQLDDKPAAVPRAAVCQRLAIWEV
jgi:hypothetical protein